MARTNIYTSKWHKTKSELALRFHSVYEDSEEYVDVVEASFLDLPNELLAMIFSFCDAQELACSVSCVCSRFQSVIFNDLSIWKESWFSWDINGSESDLNILSNVIGKFPTLQCLRVRHPGEMSEVSVAHLIRDITARHNKLKSVELEPHGAVLGYSKEILSMIHQTCGDTLLSLRIKGPIFKNSLPCLFEFTMVTRLELDFVTYLIDGDLRTLCNQCPNLKWLSIPKSAFITDSGMSYFILQKHDVLVGLEISGYMLTDKSMALLRNSPCLIYLCVYDSRNFLEQTLCAIRTLPRLHSLRLRRLNASESMLSAWLEGKGNLQKLHLLDLEYAAHMSSTLVLKIAHTCPYLRYFYVGGYVNIHNLVGAHVQRIVPSLIDWSYCINKEK